MKGVTSIIKDKPIIFILLSIITPLVLLSCYSLQRFLFHRIHWKAGHKRDLHNFTYEKRNFRMNFPIVADLETEEEKSHAAGLARINSTYIKDVLK